MMLARLRHAIAEQGFVALALRAVNAMLGRISAGRVRIVWYVLVAQPVRSDWRWPARLGRNIEIRRFEADQPLLHEASRPPEIIAYRFAQRSVCFAAVTGERLVGFLWLCPGQYYEDDVRCLYLMPANGTAWWDYDVWIAPEARNGILFAKLWHAAHEFLLARGASWTLSRIVRTNAHSLAAHARAGAEPVGNAFFLCIGSYQLALGWRPPLCHWSRRPDAVPRLALSGPTRKGPSPGPTEFARLP
jgi:hypothetical protein